jgi:hypothetical protein
LTIDLRLPYDIATKAKMTQMDVTTLRTAIGWFRIEAFAGELTRVDLFTKLEPAAESTSTVL